MSVVINGDTGISGVDGSAANPAIKGSDADTGIHFGANTAAITTGGTNKLSIDSSGDATFSGDATVSGTVKTSKVENANTSNGGVEIDTAGHVKLDGQQLPTAGTFNNRNLIINGGHVIDQRNNGASVTLSSTVQFITDRFSTKINGGGAVARQSATVPSGKGFSRSLKFDVTGADTSPAHNDEVFVQTKVEAQDLKQLSYGSSDAKSVTFSFWVRSTLTGDFGFFVYQGDAVRAYQTTYNISTANTWEYKTITLPGDVSGVMDDNTGTGFEIRWYLAVGGNKAGSSNQNAWGTNFSNRHPAGTNLMASTSNNWYVTGIQFEVGSKATPFEFESYGQTLAKCRRYLQLVNPNNGGGYAVNHFAFRDTSFWIIDFWHYPEMRAAPSLIAIGNNGLTNIPSGQVGLYNISTSGIVGFDNNTGQWDITMANLNRSTLRFTGANLQGSTGQIAGCDSILLNTLMFVSAEL